jgi:excisionase family DNA binding protein
MLTIAQVSDLLNIKISTLYAWVSQGKIPHVKIHGLIRFQAEEIQQWVISFHPQKANQLKWKGKRGRGSNKLDTIIVRAKEEAYNSRHGETRPTIEPNAEGGNYGAL